MSDIESEPEEDLDKLLNDFDDIPKTVEKPKPKLAATSKPRPGLQRKASNTDNEDDPEPEVKPVSMTSDPAKKSPFGVANVPLSARPKTNPNANLLGNVSFGKDEEKKKPFLKGKPEPFEKGPNRPEPFEKGPNRPEPFEKGPKKPLSDLDWLGIGSDSSMPSANTTPLPQRKDLTGSKVTDPFDLGPSSLSLNRGANEPITEPNRTKPNVFKPFKGKAAEPLVEQQVMKPAQKQVDFGKESGLPSFLDKLTSNRPGVNDPEAGKVNDPGGDAEGAPRKKVVTVRKTVGSAGGMTPTIQVPSHVIDAEELKRMFVSQKQLYESQVSMLEGAYKEQIACIRESFARKEDMLKEEIKMIQKEYEERIARIKAELVDAELRPIQFRAQNQDNFHLLSKLSDQVKELQLQGADVQASHGNTSTLDLSEVIGQAIDVKLSAFLTSLQRSLSQRHESDERQLDQRILERFDSISAQLESHSKIQQDALASSGKDKDQAEKLMDTAIGKVLKEQKKLRETLIKSTVTAMTQGLESKHEDQRKRDKISMLIRENRKEMQRFFSDFDSKQDSLQKSQRHMEAEQKVLHQTFHDLATWLHMNSSSNSALNSNSLNQSSIQNEMELKMLKDERNALSEAIAQINVDKRRIADEKVQIEGGKRDFERMRGQIQELETTLRMKIADAEESKKHIEISRAEQTKVTSDLSRKMTELEKERMRFREMTQALELTSGLEKQRLTEERSELVRDREFLEKLRHQFLCPNCLRLVRSEGDGHDTQTLTQAPASRQPPITPTPRQLEIYASTVNQQDPPPTPHLDLERKGRELKTIIANYYGDRN